MKNTLLFLLLVPSLAYSRTTEIQNWETVYPQKGYILSKDLWDVKNCAKPYTKQIPAFKERNPQIPNPDLILVNQRIEVQNCNVTVGEEIVQEDTILPVEHTHKKHKEKNKDDSHFFVGAYTGASFLSKDKPDSEKFGYNLGLKVGYNFNIKRKYNFAIALGYMFNESKTSQNAGNGKYRLQTQFANLELHYNKQVTKKAKFGLIANLLTADDVSLKDKDANQKTAAYAGIEHLYSLSKSIDIESNLQQRVDTIDRANLMLNLGLRFKF